VNLVQDRSVATSMTKTNTELATIIWQPTRHAALSRLAAFVPNAGQQYAARRNYDFGPDDRSNVSALSPWVRYRAIHETEILSAVLGRYSLSTAEKFIQEVFWRSYFKGWLEQRPAVWRNFCTRRDQLLARLDEDDALATRYAEAVSGQTGIDCFDAWATELTQTGYLHNHARMWFASIWIFTLQLPWQLGADFFYRHLLDGDPASNTCSWRWVAGLHTRGKNYVARAYNIEKYTDGRFKPNGQLARDPLPLEDEENPPRSPLPVPAPVDRSAPSLLMLHEDQLSLAHLPLGDWNLKGVLIADLLERRSPRAVGEPVRTHVTGLIAECHNAIKDRLGFSATVVTSMDGLASHASSCGAEQVIVPCVPTGHVADEMPAAIADLEPSGVGFGVYQHRYDEQTWPHATAGFFKLKKQIPGIVEALGLK
jgi:deoxyribodipyrimidine photo-lyase